MHLGEGGKGHEIVAGPTSSPSPFFYSRVSSPIAVLSQALRDGVDAAGGHHHGGDRSSSISSIPGLLCSCCDGA